jgi:hypothetical protein
VRIPSRFLVAFFLAFCAADAQNTPKPALAVSTTAPIGEPSQASKPAETTLTTGVNATARSLMDFGCKGDGKTDDTACVQAAAGFMPQSGPGVFHGRGVYCPPGVYKITSTVTFSSLIGGSLRGGGQACDFMWFGEPGGPMFDLQNVAETVFDGFRMSVDAKSHLTEAIRMQQTAGYKVSHRRNHFQNLWIDGNLGKLDIGIRGMIGTAGDVQGEMMLFTNVNITHYLQTAWSIEGTQMMGWRMENCRAVGFDGSGHKLGKYAVSGGSKAGIDQGARANFFWHGGYTGFNSVADFFFLQPSGSGVSTTIADFNSEGSDRFLLVALGNNGNTTRTTIDGVRWSSDGVNADGKFMILYGTGPFFIRNSQFGPGFVAQPLSMQWNYMNTHFPPYMEITGSTIFTSLRTFNTVFNTSSGKAPTYVWGSVAQQDESNYVVLDSIRMQTARTNTENSFIDNQGFHPSMTDGDKAVPFISGANGPLRTGDMTWDNANHRLSLHSPGSASLTFDSVDGAGSGLGSRAGALQVMARTSNDEIDIGYGASPSLAVTAKFPMNGGFQLASGGMAACNASTRGKFVYLAGAAGAKDQVAVCAKDAADLYGYRIIY